MKRLLLFICGVFFAHMLHAQNFNLTLRSTLPYPGVLANIGGYVDTVGNEYALVGYEFGLSIVDVTDPDNPFIAFDVTGPTSNWREVKTWGKYAYVTTEGGSSGLQIIDLTNLPNAINSKFWKGSGAINNQLTTIHALHIDAGYVYLFGSDLFNGTAIIADLADPWNPVYVGNIANTYVHDGYVRNDTLWAGHIYDGVFRVWDVAAKASPVLLAEQQTPNSFTHNTWLNDAGSVLLTTDETNNSFLAAYDVSDINNITELDRFQTTPGSNSIVHNTHVINDYAVTSWYKDGVSICDVSRPDNIVQVARYDTYTQGTGPGFSGCWGVYPFLPSGTIVVSDIDNGLFVLTPTYLRACYLEGLVTDSVSGLPLNNATITVTGIAQNEVTGLNGIYKTGTVNANTYTVTVTRSGYATKVFNNVVLVNGQVTQLDAPLVPTTAFTASGQVIDAMSGLGVPNAQVRMFNANADELLVCDANGNFAIAGFVPANYNIDAAMWGYITFCSNANLVNATTVPLTIQLMPGIADDFTFDLGWTVSGPSPNAWERGVPIGTTLGGPGPTLQANPGADALGDCRDKAYVTDNGGGGAWDNDVDYGSTILSSPVFDATGFLNPRVYYTRWFFNGGNNGSGSPDDTMSIYITNGTTTALVERIFNNTPLNSTWVDTSFFIAQYVTPTATMQLIVETADWGPTFNVVEGGLDKFALTEGPVGIATHEGISINVAPNPSNDQFTITFGEGTLSNESLLQVTDLAGKVVAEQLIPAGATKAAFGYNLSPGYYLVQISGFEGVSRIIKM